MDTDAVSIFADALKEEGLDGEIMEVPDPASLETVYRIKISTPKGPKYCEVSIDQLVHQQSDDKRQLIATQAANIAQNLKYELTETIEWDDKAVQIDNSADPEATCRVCGASVTLQNIRDSLTHIRMGESSIPNPPPPDLRSLSDHKQMMVLLGALRRECDTGCPNSPYDDVYRNL